MDTNFNQVHVIHNSLSSYRYFSNQCYLINVYWLAEMGEYTSQEFLVDFQQLIMTNPILQTKYIN